MIAWFRDNPFASQMLIGIIAGAISGILFASGFGAIVLSIFISLLVCGLLMLAREYYQLRNELIALAEMTRQSFNNLTEGFSEELETQQEGHHEDIQGIYRVLSNILGEED